MKDFTIDQQKNMIAFSGSHFRLPLLLRVSDNRVEPLPESEYSAPLRSSWPISPRAITSSGSTLLQNGPALVAAAGALHRLVRLPGQLGGEQIVQHVDKAQWKGKTAFKDTVIDTAATAQRRYAENRRQRYSLQSRQLYL
jgi:phosphoglycerol transferase